MIHKIFRAIAALLVLACLTQGAYAGVVSSASGRSVCGFADNEQFILDGYLATGEGARDIERSDCGNQSGPFLLGVEEGLKGERFAFYLGSADPEQDRDFLKHYYACAEFGVPFEKDGKMARLDAVVDKSMFKDQFMSPVSNMLAEFGRAVLNWVSYTWNKMFGDAKTIKELKADLEKARKEADEQARKDELKKISAQDAKKKPKDAGAAQAYACCIRGFMRGSGILSQLIRETENYDCKDSFVSRCKSYYRAGAGKAAMACYPETPANCAKCDIQDINQELEPDKGAKKGLLGCASTGYVDQYKELKTAGQCSEKSQVSAKTADRKTKRLAVDTGKSATKKAGTSKVGTAKGGL